jgi:hypothetical protein
MMLLKNIFSKKIILEENTLCKDEHRPLRANKGGLLFVGRKVYPQVVGARSFVFGNNLTHHQQQHPIVHQLFFSFQLLK